MKWPNFAVSFMKNGAVVETNFYFFLVLKYIIFVKIIKNFTYVIVPGFTWRHYGSRPLLWNIFSRRLCRCFWYIWQCFLYMCCRVINTYFFLCYSYFYIQVSMICYVDYGCSERTAFIGRRFIHNIWYHFLMGNWGVTRSAKKELSSIDCEPLLSTLGKIVGVSDDCFILTCTSFRT